MIINRNRSTRHLRIITVYSILMLLVSCLYAQQLPPKKKILADMALANNYFMQKWPDAGATVTVNDAKGTPVTRTSNLWTRAVYYEGLMAMYAVDPQKKYLDYAVNWGEKHQWSPRDAVNTRNADNQACGQTYIDLYQIDNKPEQIQKIKESIDLMIAGDKINDWTWVDALQMGMPVFAKLGAVYKDNKYYERMYQMYLYTKTVEGGGLYNTTEHLWWRDKDFAAPYKEPNGANCYWSRGNGWVFAALVRVLSIMPKNAPHRDEYVKTFLEMAPAIIPLQREDGYWNVSLKDPTHFGGKELTGTALFIYGIAWGVNNGLLNQKEYLPVITKGWNALIKNSLHPEGFLGYVQGTGKQPSDSQPVSYTHIPDFEDYGLGCFLLAGSEVYKLGN
jgi:unsaturated rhamnogalacturonyl hydrolase